MTWTLETEPALMRASLPARLGHEKPHETQAPYSRADIRKLCTVEQLLNQGLSVAVACSALEVSAPT
jgi:hypothetical protein